MSLLERKLETIAMYFQIYLLDNSVAVLVGLVVDSAHEKPIRIRVLSGYLQTVTGFLTNNLTVHDTIIDFRVVVVLCGLGLLAQILLLVLVDFLAVNWNDWRFGDDRHIFLIDVLLVCLDVTMLWQFGVQNGSRLLDARRRNILLGKLKNRK
jgi:hypothetical protein